VLEREGLSKIVNKVAWCWSAWGYMFRY